MKIDSKEVVKMIIAEKIEKGYKNQIKTIKNEKNRLQFSQRNC